MLGRYPRTITDGHGSDMTFRERIGDTLVFDGRIAPQAGPPPHVHHLQDEVVRVMRGRLGYQTGDGAPQFAGPGEEATFPKGEVHRFWNDGDEELLLEGTVSPALNFEFFISEIYESMRRNGGRPGAFDSAFLLRRYHAEFAMPEIPAPVRKAVFPVLAAAGRVLGRYRRFADAPAPVGV